LCSPHYQKIWSPSTNHLHHGLWRTGKETKEEASDQMVKELLQHAQHYGLPAAPKVLDVGCGMGGTSCYLTKNLPGAHATGVSLSTEQIKMCKEHAAKAGVSERTRFLEGDGEKLTELLGAEAHGTFDAVWISEALSHFPHKDVFFAEAVKMLKPGGKLVLADWFRADHISEALVESVVKPIEIGMLLPKLDTMSTYISLLTAAGLRLVWLEDVSKETAQTWDISISAIMNPSMWSLAWTLGSDTIQFVKTFQNMKEGFSSGAFRYGLLVAEKPLGGSTTA
jgi:tocopherol O-methyltransferase